MINGERGNFITERERERERDWPDSKDWPILLCMFVCMHHI